MSGHVNRFLIFLAFIANACASVTPPNGGPQDLNPPKLVNSVPESKTLHYRSQKIVLEFDEQVELRDLQKELIITPYTENTYKSRADKNTITLEFEKPLEENTTYTLNFRKSIRDLTEGNIAELAPLTFSTGSFLDSGTVSGTVVKLLTNKPETDADVLLYRTTDTGTVKTTKPLYVSRTDATGNYQFTNLATGVYRIYALTDKNNSLTYDQDIERIGFLPDTIVITANTPSVHISTTQIDTRKPFITKRSPQADRLELEYNEGLKAINIRSLTETDSILYVQEPDPKRVSIFRQPEQKEIRFIATATDSLNFIGTDTITAIFVKPFKREDARLYLKSNAGLYNPDEPFLVQATHPVKTVQPGAFTILDDSVEVISVDPLAISLTEGGRSLTFKPFKLPNKLTRFTLKADTARIQTLTGHVFEPFVQELQLANGNTTGSLKGQIITLEHNFLLQLLDKDFKVIKSLPNTSAFYFQNLAPGVYKLRLIADRNANGKWDNASEDLKTLPEPIYFHTEELNVRANWELEDIVFSKAKPVDNKAKKK